MDHIETRVGILEVKMSAVETNLSDASADLGAYGRRFDDYVKEELKSANLVALTVQKVNTTVDGLATEMSRTNKSLDEFVEKMKETHTTVNEWQIAWTLIYRASGVLVLIIGAAWGLFKYFHGVT